MKSEKHGRARTNGTAPVTSNTSAQVDLGHPTLSQVKTCLLQIAYILADQSARELVEAAANDNGPGTRDNDDDEGPECLR